MFYALFRGGPKDGEVRAFEGDIAETKWIKTQIYDPSSIKDMRSEDKFIEVTYNVGVYSNTKFFDNNENAYVFNYRGVE